MSRQRGTQRSGASRKTSENISYIDSDPGTDDDEDSGSESSESEFESQDSSESEDVGDTDSSEVEASVESATVKRGSGEYFI